MNAIEPERSGGLDPNMGGVGHRPTPIERLRSLIARFDLTYSGGVEPTWSGSTDGVALLIIAAPGAAGTTRLRFELAIPPSRGSLLVIAASHVLAFKDGLHTGDRAFDERTFVQSSEISALGCFDASTRVLAGGLTALGAYVSQGALRLDSDSLDAAALADIESIVDQLVRFAKRLNMGQAQANDELVDIARADPEPRVRETFARHVESTSELRDADSLARVRSESADEDASLGRLANQLNDPNNGRAVRIEAGMRLLALFPLKRIARALSLVEADIAPTFIERLASIIATSQGDEAGAKAQRELAATILLELATRHPQVDDEALERILVALARAPLQSSFALVSQQCERKNAAIVMRALVVLHKLERPAFEVMRALSPAAKAEVQQALPGFAKKHPELGASLLIEFFERIEARHVASRISYLRAMALTGDTRVGARVAKELDSPYEEVLFAVVEALEHLGDLTVVPALKPLTEGLFRSGPLKTAARKTIEAIRKREGAKSLPGALSLSESASEGALSLSDEALRSEANPEQPGHDEE